ncbi:uncharacterized protein LOC135818886 [Sycon ciliatum]|uniref:uncharacterized protein LOC135818886 n=1 Tax=Sycon ciliatum TaxID=27933 RepID=UPI0031F71100
MKVQIISEDDVYMLRYGARDRGLYEHLGEMYFISSSPLTGIALGGEPGARGYFRFRLLDDTAKEKKSKDGFYLDVPFELRPCFGGFYGPDVAVTIEYQPLTPLTKVCYCMNSSAIQKCSKGRFVDMKPGYWAGNVTTNSRLDSEKNPLDWKSTGENVVFETESNTSNITFKETQVYGSFVNYPFGIAQCTNGLCKSSAWLYNGSGTPACVGNAAGILCGECRAGTRLKLALAQCVDCSMTSSIPLWVYVITMVVMTVLTSILLFYFNVGLSPVLDSWLFFVQTSWYIFPNEVTFVYSSIYTVLTFGLGHVCLKEDVNRLQVSTLLLIQPITLLLIFLAIRIARSYNYLGTRLARLQSHMKLVRVMWFVLVYSYFMLTFTALSVFWCVQINDRQVLAMDGSVDCYVSPHLGYVLAAAAILAIVILPPPLLLLIRRTHGHIMLKGFVDEACCMYTDECRWWSAVNLLRRIAIGLLGSLPFSSAVSRLLVTSGFLLLLQMLHSKVQPLRKGDLAGVGYNTWESFMLCISICIAVLYSVMYESQMTENYVLWVSGALFLTPTALVLTALLYRQCLAKEGGYGRFRTLSVRRIWQHWQRGRGRERNESHLDETALANLIGDIRDPLLVDNIRDQQEGRL